VCAASRLAADGSLDMALEDAVCWQGLERCMSGFDESMQKLVTTLRKPSMDALLEGMLAHLSLNSYYN
jgi:hypothetical protein